MRSGRNNPLDDQKDAAAPEDGTTISDGQESPGLPELAEEATSKDNSPLVSTPVTPTVSEIVPALLDAQHSGEASQPSMPLPYAAAPVTPPYTPYTPPPVY